MNLSPSFISAVQNVFTDVPSLNTLLFKGEVVAVQAFLQIAYRDYELTPNVVLSHLCPLRVEELRDRAIKAQAILQLLDEMAPLVREEKRRQRLEEERED